VFSVSDDGPGVDPQRLRSGADIGNMRDRVEAVGGEFNATTAPGSVSFTNFQNLTGGSGKDTFKLIGTASLTGAIDGGSGSGLNTLDYSGYTPRVVVSVAAHAGTGIKNRSGSGVNQIQALALLAPDLRVVGAEVGTVCLDDDDARDVEELSRQRHRLSMVPG